MHYFRLEHGNVAWELEYAVPDFICVRVTRRSRVGVMDNVTANFFLESEPEPYC
jgi:hypothetical protein